MTIEEEKRTEFSIKPYASIIDDEDTIRRMTDYFRQSNTDELLKYIKSYGIRRPSDEA